MSQVGFATALVFGAALLGKSMQKLASADPGFDPTGVTTFRITAPPEARPGDEDVRRYFEEARAELLEIPGVLEAGFVGRLPMAGGRSSITVFPEGFEAGPDGRLPQAGHRLVTAGYLETMGARLRTGRLITTRDNQEEGHLKGVINQSFAERHWPDQDPIGKRLLGRGGVTWLEVVGVIEDLEEDGPERAFGPAVYLPHRDWPVAHDVWGRPDAGVGRRNRERDQGSGLGRRDRRSRYPGP